MKILILFDLNRAPTAEETFAAPQDLAAVEKQTEADLFECLKRLGHEVVTLAVFNQVRVIFEKVEAFKPDVVFNVCESFHCDRAHEPNIPALLDLMSVKYTGAGPDAPDAPPR